MSLRRRLLLLLAVVAVAAVASASMPAPRPAALDVKRRFVEPKGCCEVDPDMCRAGTSWGGLTRAEVLAGLSREGAPARACLTATTPTAKVRFRVGPDGVPTGVETPGPLPDDVGRCLRDAVSAIRFPSTSRGLGVPISFRFERRR